MKKISIALMLTIIGCADVNWRRPPGVSELKYKQDRFECMSITGHTEISLATGVSAKSIERRNMFNACMEAKGYTSD